MTFDDAVEAFVISETLPEEPIQWVLDAWDTTAADCRALLAGYLDGHDMSERTEQALFVVILLLAEQEDTASHPNLCRLALDKDRCSSVLGEDDAPAILPSVLISTFDGDASPILRIVDAPDADDLIRGELLTALAYLVRTDGIPEAEFYQYLSRFPDKMPESTPDFVWYGWMRAVAMLGFAGLAQRVEQVLQRGSNDPQLMDSATFWNALRAAQADPDDTAGILWAEVGPIGRAVDFLRPYVEAEGDEALYDPPPEPIRNPMRHVGRNDPCPCGSGRKYKKCCLAV